MSALARELLAGIVAELRADPRLAGELRQLLGVAPSTPEHGSVYLRVAAYAERISVSERHAWDLVRRGLPCIGVGRGRRVDVVAADGWMRARREHAEDRVEREARAAARRSATRSAK